MPNEPETPTQDLLVNSLLALMERRNSDDAQAQTYADLLAEPLVTAANSGDMKVALAIARRTHRHNLKPEFAVAPSSKCAATHDLFLWPEQNICERFVN